MVDVRNGEFRSASDLENKISDIFLFAGFHQDPHALPCLLRTVTVREGFHGAEGSRRNKDVRT